MAYRTDKFKIGDIVAWADDHYATIVSSRVAYGDGPFTVVSVMDRENHSDYPYGDELAQSRWDSMGHTQHVEVGHECGFYSGAFFKKLDQ